MNILVACEESQTVCIELRKLGHRAYSCDIEKCSGGHPEWHINDDVEYALKSKERERLHYLSPSADRAKIRSKTFLGIAKAMAEQWSGRSGKRKVGGHNGI